MASEYKITVHLKPRFAYSRDLQCDWLSWKVLNDGILRLDLPVGNCCDMGGAIKVATAMYPMCWRIDVYVDGAFDVMYSRAGGRGWVAKTTYVKIAP